MENKIKCEIEEIKTYPSNISIQVRYENQEGEYEYLSYDVDMDYIFNSDYLDMYEDTEEANKDILENLIKDIQEGLPEGYYFDDEEIEKIEVPMQWEVEDLHLKRD